MSDSILHTGVQNIQASLAQFDRASHQIASSQNSTSNNGQNSLDDGLLQVKQAQRSVEVSVAVIKAADETLGSLLNELA